MVGTVRGVGVGMAAEKNEVLERAAWLVKVQRDRVALQQEIANVLTLDWNEEAIKGKPDWVQEIKDPQPFNAIQTFVDVMAHDEPQVKIGVPEGSLHSEEMDLGNPEEMDALLASFGGGSGEVGEGNEKEKARELGDKLERVVQEIFVQNDLRLPTSLQRDELYAAFGLGMIVNKTADMRFGGERWSKYAARNRGASPFYIRSVNPTQVYFEYDEYGLCEVFHRYLRPLKEVVRIYGENVLGLGGLKAQDANGQVLFCEYWTNETRATWVENVYSTGDVDPEKYFTNELVNGGYFLQAPKANGLEFIPYDVKIARGTSIFNRNNMVFPHLYAGHKSKLFLRNNLFFTVAASLAFMLVNPQVFHETDTPENPVQIDFSTPGTHGIRKGDKITPLELRITPEFEKVMTLFAQKIEESTVSKVVAGQSPGGVTAAAGINLLVGGGKLTVTSVQKALGEGRAGTIRTLFNYMRAYAGFAGVGEKSDLDIYARGVFNTLKPNELPDHIDISVKYEPFLPQDKALAMQTWLTPVLQGLISSDYFYEQVGVQDVVTLREQLEADKDRKQADMMYEQQVQQGIQQAQAEQQMQMQGQQEALPPEGMGGEQLGDQVVGQAEVNPMASQANPANELNAQFNAMQNPMTVGK